MSPNTSGQHVAFSEHECRAYDGTRIYYRLSEPKGQAAVGEPLESPWLVLADGIACDGFVWAHLIPYFAPRARILHWHYRGHGKSEAPADFRNLSVPDLARDLDTVMDDAGVLRAVLLGHSMGVQTILEFYRSYAGKVAGLVPICGSYEYPLNTFHDSTLLKKALPWMRLGVKSAPGIARVLQRVAKPEMVFRFGWLMAELNRDRIRREDMLPYFEHLGTLDLDLFTTMLYYASLHSAADVLAEITVPTLVISATRDSFTPGWLSDEMHGRIPGSEHLVLRDGSHAAPVEYSDLVNLRLEKFLIDHGLITA
mgnify:CR=1 FL=1